MTKRLGEPRVVVEFHDADMVYRVVYTGTHYDLQEQVREGWSLVTDEFSTLASLLDREDSPEVKMRFPRLKAEPMKQFHHNGKTATAPDGHRVVVDGSHMLDLGLDLRSEPEDDFEQFCSRCGDVLPLDGKCDCLGREAKE